MPTILEEYIAKHAGSAQRYAEAVGIFPSGVTHDNRYAEPFPLYITHGLGPRKWDVDGNEYIDYVSGHGALILGHSHPAIAAAVTEQINRGTHLGACTDEEVRWAKAVQALMPSVERIRFHSSGTEATLMAMRLARAYTGKNKVIKLQDHFHGWHDYAMAGSDRSSPGIPPETFGSMVIVPSGDLAAVEAALDRDSDIAALILEPTGAHYGQLPFDVPNYLSGLRELTAQHSVVLIFDEVVTGFRASSGGAQVRYGVSPDLTTMAKIVAGALPGGAVGGKAEIVDMIAHRGDPDWDNKPSRLPPRHLQRQPADRRSRGGLPGNHRLSAHQPTGRCYGRPAQDRPQRHLRTHGSAGPRPRHRFHDSRCAGRLRLRPGNLHHASWPHQAGHRVACRHRLQAGPAQSGRGHHGPRCLPGVRHPHRGGHRRNAGGRRGIPGRSPGGGVGVR